MQLLDLCRFCDDYLQVEEFSDYCPNGLQVEGRAEVRRLISGVTASLDLIEAAIDLEADAILVHHGYFWKNEPAVLTGYKGKRIKTLMQNDISLLAYHLPLDYHPSVGNNAQLALKMGWLVQQQGKLWRGELIEETDIDVVMDSVAERLNTEPLLIYGSNRPVKSIAWCTGAAQSMIDDAITESVDLFMSGEISEQTVHVAKESGMHYIAAGHHATERYGVQALGQLVANRFGIHHQYVEIDNPV